MLLLAKQAAICASAMRAGESIWMEVALQPDHANARIEQVGDRKVYHTAMIPRCTLATHEPKAQAIHEHRAKEHAQHAGINRAPADPVGAIGAEPVTNSREGRT